MGYTEILVQVGTDAGADRRLAIAADLASRFQARLVGVFLEPPPMPLYTPAGFVAPVTETQAAALLEQHRTAVEAQARAARTAFDAASRGLQSDWRSIDGALAGSLMAAARPSDLLVVPGSPGDNREGVVAPPDVVALESGAPIIVVPAVGAGAEIGRRVLVAWNGSREAARALRDALPLLTRAEAVTGVIVGHPPEARDGEATLAAWFDRHSCKGSVVRVPGDDADAGEPILRHAAQTSVDLIVMGFYGHSRLREFILGGASRRMLAHSPVPLFLAH